MISNYFLNGKYFALNKDTYYETIIVPKGSIFKIEVNYNSPSMSINYRNFLFCYGLMLTEYFFFPLFNFKIRHLYFIDAPDNFKSIHKNTGYEASSLINFLENGYLLSDDEVSILDILV